MATLKLIAPGMVYLMPDKSQKIPHQTSRHNYIVLNSPDETNKRVACMLITSMANDGYHCVVPIITSTGTVSYIVPTHVIEYTDTSFNVKCFHGMVQDDILTADAFLSMLIQLYTGHMFGNKFINPEINKIYKDYCNEFWEKHNDCQQYREKKTGKLFFNKPDPNEVDVIIRKSEEAKPIEEVTEMIVTPEPIIQGPSINLDKPDTTETEDSRLIYSSSTGVMVDDPEIENYTGIEELEEEFDNTLGNQFADIFKDSHHMEPNQKNQVKIKKKGRSTRLSKNERRILAKRDKQNQKKFEKKEIKSSDKEVEDLFGFIEPFPVLQTRNRRSNTYTNQEITYVLEIYRNHNLQFVMDTVFQGMNMNTAYSRVVSLRKEALERNLYNEFPAITQKSK